MALNNILNMPMLLQAVAAARELTLCYLKLAQPISMDSQSSPACPPNNF